MSITSAPKIPVKIQITNKQGQVLKTVLRNLRPGGLNRAWYILYEKQRLKVYGDSMDDAFIPGKRRYVILGEDN